MLYLRYNAFHVYSSLDTICQMPHAVNKNTRNFGLRLASCLRRRELSYNIKAINQIMDAWKK